MKNPRQEVDDGSGSSRLGEETMKWQQHSQCCRTRQCDDLGCCVVEEEEEEEVEKDTVGGQQRSRLEGVSAFRNERFLQDSFVQFLELKHRTKLKSLPEEFVANVTFDSRRSGSCSRSCSRWQKPAKLAWLVMASVVLFSAFVSGPVGLVQGNEIRPSQARMGPLKKGGECERNGTGFLGEVMVSPGY